MKILITGAKGTVGQELIKQLSKENVEIIPTDMDTLDITNIGAVSKFLLEQNPDVVIHLAAATDVDWCETHPRECFKVNTEASENLATVSKEIGAVFVFPSTTFVFSGEEGKVYDDRKEEPSLEDVVGVYSKSKLMAELAIQKIGGRYFIIRWGQLFFGGEGGDKKFVGKLINSAQEGKGEIKVVSDRKIQPTYITDMVKNLIALIKTQNWGIYNMVSKGQASYYEFAQEVLKQSNIGNVKLIPISSSEFRELAPRPSHIYAVNGKLQDLGLDLMREWQVGLKEYLENLKV